MLPQRCYRIVDGSSGGFLVGGANPKWARHGDVWFKARDVINELCTLAARLRSEPEAMGSVAVECYTLVPVLFARVPAEEFPSLESET